MNSNQLRYDPHGYEKLIDEEAHSTRQDPQHLQQSSSGIYQRTSVFNADVANSSSSTQSETKSENTNQKKPQQKGMKSCFGTCYKVWMFLQILGSGFGLLGTFVVMISTQEFEKSHCMILVCSLVQSVFALSGARRESIEKIERALILMYVGLVMTILTYLGEAFEDLKEFKKLTTQREDLGANFYLFLILSNFAGVAYYLLSIILPTIKARNRIRASSPSHQNQEVVVSDDMNDPIEKLSSWKYIVYKYWVLIALCWTVTNIGQVIYSYFSDGASVFEKLRSDRSYQIEHFTSWLVNILFLAILFLVFEGIRRKNLAKLLRAIKLMKILCVIELIQHCSFPYFNDVSEIFEKHYENNPEHLELFRKMGTFWVGFFGVFLILARFYIGYFYGACKVRNILKDHKKANYKL